MQSGENMTVELADKRKPAIKPLLAATPKNEKLFIIFSVLDEIKKR
ncbi:10045_t:CDS:2 [Diversispora eburnea]|uniref:10045_t:CDS:1 n=1 Tax=Diversispora eburnea TaxID=1213867 RepID=A0A9N8ZDW4_9GLOM|nr:10045_t:CDS:2 [Diversispora eburnea]